MRCFAQVFLLILLATALHMSRSADIAEATPDDVGCVLPDVGDISSIVADMYWHPFAPLGAPDIANFQIPRENFAEVLQPFQQSVPDNKIRPDFDEIRQPDLSEIGTIRINLKEGGCLRICWFDRGQNRLYFSCAGRRYVRFGVWIGKVGNDETLNVDGHIRKLHQDLNKKQVPMNCD